VKLYRVILRWVINLVLVSLALLVVAVGVGVRTGNVHLDPVLSGSMRPIAPGDLAVTRRVPTSSLQVGDVIVFYPPGETATPKMHRIVTLARAGAVTTVTTKGDANNAVDPWGPVTLRDTSAYRLAAVVPKVGWVPIWITHIPGHGGRATLLIVAGLLIAFVGLRVLRTTDGQTGHPRHRKKMAS
jgi:signal peptidase I